jgi:hypothetical protein
MENREVNDLLEFNGVVNDWLSFFIRGSARLYDRDSRQCGRASRKRLGESLALL